MASSKVRNFASRRARRPVTWAAHRPARSVCSAVVAAWALVANPYLAHRAAAAALAWATRAATVLVDSPAGWSPLVGAGAGRVTRSCVRSSSGVSRCR